VFFLFRGFKLNDVFFFVFCFDTNESTIALIHCEREQPRPQGRATANQEKEPENKEPLKEEPHEGCVFLM
jgi:hypothetical protein